MQPISGLISGAAQPSASIAGVKEPPKVRRPEEEARDRSLKPAMDAYIPEEKQEPSGRYWPGKDEDGKLKIYFDDPAQAENASEKPEEVPDTDASAQDKGAEGPEKSGSDKNGKRCTVSTDKVDREIKELKKKQEELTRQINSETDDAKIKELERKLAQAERELRQKDNDAYRRQHAVYAVS